MALLLTTARAALAAEAHAGFPARGARHRAARAALAKVLWNARGERKLPSNRALDAALHALPASELEWMFELSPLGPLYFLPTSSFVRALAKTVRSLGVTRVLEVAAGDGLLARSLQRVAPELDVRATDSGAWSDPNARMTAAERRQHAGREVPGLALSADVERSDARRAIRRHTPGLVLCAWLPPGHMLDGLIRAPVDYVLELGAGAGITGSAYSWRFAHEFLEGELTKRARCRLDHRPQRQLHSRATLYFGRAHGSYFEERVRAGDWLYQFKPPRGS